MGSVEGAFADRVNLVGANPVFGLNALGGALAIEMKNGFSYEGGEAVLSASLGAFCGAGTLSS